MGPKAKDKKKGKEPPPTAPEVDPNEVVTELMKQFFEFQLADIDKKLGRLSFRQEQLKAETSEIEEKIEEFRKEKAVVVAEEEQHLAEKEEEKNTKIEETIWLQKEIKIRFDQHQRQVTRLQDKFNEMVREFTEELEKIAEEVKLLEDFKHNKESYLAQNAALEAQIQQSEMQHQRNLFEINRKWEMAKVKVKKELETRLLQLSIEFQQTSQKKIGGPCHRVSQENKAIQNELNLMRDELVECEDKSKKAKKNIHVYKAQEEMKKAEKEKALARTVIQMVVVKALIKDRILLLEKLKAFAQDEVDNKTLQRKLKVLEIEVEKKMSRIEVVNNSLKEKMEETNSMNLAALQLKRKTRMFQVLLRNGLKIAEEAAAVHLIPMGGTDEEKYMKMDAKIRIYRKRRDFAFQKKGRILRYLLDFLAKAHLSEEDMKLLKGSQQTIDNEVPTSSSKIVEGQDKDLEHRDSPMLPALQEERSEGSESSDVSLPRSMSVLGGSDDEDKSRSNLSEIPDQDLFAEEITQEEKPSQPAAVAKETAQDKLQVKIVDENVKEVEEGEKVEGPTDQN